MGLERGHGQNVEVPPGLSHQVPSGRPPGGCPGTCGETGSGQLPLWAGCRHPICTRQIRGRQSRCSLNERVTRCVTQRASVGRTTVLALGCDTRDAEVFTAWTVPPPEEGESSPLRLGTAATALGAGAGHRGPHGQLRLHRRGLSSCHRLTASGSQCLCGQHGLPGWAAVSRLGPQGRNGRTCTGTSVRAWLLGHRQGPLSDRLQR